MKTKLHQLAPRQFVMVAMAAAVALLLVLAILAFSSIDSGILSTKMVTPAFQSPSTKCTDGTPLYACSRVKPYMCVKLNNVLTYQQNCAKCGCPSGLKCQNGYCVSMSGRSGGY